MFLYVPLVHTEFMLVQVDCVRLYQGMAARAKEPGSGMRELLKGALRGRKWLFDLVWFSAGIIPQIL